MEPSQKLSIDLKPIDNNNITEYASLLLKNQKELKELYIDTGVHDTLDKIKTYVLDEHDLIAFPIMGIYINNEIQGQISVDHWNELGELVFWLDPAARGTGAFKNIIKVFLDKYFIQNYNKPLIWATSSIAKKSTYMSQCFGFNKLCSYYEEDVELSPTPFLTNVHWITPRMYWLRATNHEFNQVHEVTLIDQSVLLRLLHINQDSIIHE